jgi:hypothetical protein
MRNHRNSITIESVFPLPTAINDDGHLSQELWSEIRVAQSVELVRQMPMIIAGNGLSALIGYFALLSVNVDRVLIILPVLMWLALTPMFVNWARLRNYPIPKTVSLRRIRKITAYSGALGALWAALEVYYLPATPFEVAAFLMAGCGFLIIAAVAALSVLPWACLAYAAPMMLAATFIAAWYNHPAHVPMTLLLLLMSAGLFWFLRQNWLNFSSFTRNEAELPGLRYARADQPLTVPLSVPLRFTGSGGPERRGK